MVSQAYDRIADSYDEDWCGLYAESSRRAVAQIVAVLTDAADLHVADLAVGTGNTLDSLYHRLSLGTAAGFDVSTGMLGKAWEKLPRRAQLIHDSAANAGDYLTPASLDLVLCHFLLRYLEPQVVLPTAYALLKPGGHFSLVTTTQRSLMETYTGRFAKTEPLLGVRRQLAKGGNPLDHAQGMEMLERYGFEIVADHLYREVVTFRSFDDVRAWACESGWAVEIVDGRMSVRFAFLRVAFALAEIFMRPLYPVDATNEISIVLARKPC
ncbi:MAG: class I SAM-dependent methyltransferase [Gammaproteobacteria bacterium]|nr:class I SAM-dependent methyltransferase [Gammaproteobacteria bacterium]